MDLVSNIKTKWEEVTVDDFLQLKSVEESDFHSFLSFKMDQLCILTESSIDDEIWDGVDTDQLESLFDKLKWLSVQPTRNFVNTISLNNKDYSFKDLSK